MFYFPAAAFFPKVLNVHLHGSQNYTPNLTAFHPLPAEPQRLFPAVRCSYPHQTVPFGADKNNVPQGITFAARPGEDEKLLNLGYSFESHVNGRLTL